MENMILRDFKPSRSSQQTPCPACLIMKAGKKSWIFDDEKELFRNGENTEMFSFFKKILKE